MLATSCTCSQYLLRDWCLHHSPISNRTPHFKFCFLISIKGTVKASQAENGLFCSAALSAFLINSEVAELIFTAEMDELGSPVLPRAFLTPLPLAGHRCSRAVRLC